MRPSDGNSARADTDVVAIVDRSHQIVAFIPTLHRVRERWVSQRTGIINRFRAFPVGAWRGRAPKLTPP
jgi:hypothetical protein